MKQFSSLLMAGLAVASFAAVAGNEASAFKPGDGVLLAQAAPPLSLTCSVTPAGARNSFTASYCNAPYAASRYSVVFRITGGSANQSYAWSIPEANNCTSTSAACSFTTTARGRDVDGTAYVTVTDLGTGAVSTLEIDYFVPITCYYNGFGYQFC